MTSSSNDREALRDAVWEVLVNASNYPAEVSFRLLGLDLGPLIDKVTDAILTEFLPAYTERVKAETVDAEYYKATVADMQSEIDSLQDEQNLLASLIPDEYDGDESQAALLERFVRDAASHFERVKAEALDDAADAHQARFGQLVADVTLSTPTSRWLHARADVIRGRRESCIKPSIDEANARVLLASTEYWDAAIVRRTVTPWETVEIRAAGNNNLEGSR